MKVDRQAKILELIQLGLVETQKELADKLKELGYNVTQATISRDIRELKITKITVDDGKQVYSSLQINPEQAAERRIKVFKNAVIAVDYAGNLVIIKTLQGMAMAVASALDNMEYVEVVGSIAGDDTLFCAVRSEEKAMYLLDKLKGLLML